MERINNAAIIMNWTQSDDVQSFELLSLWLKATFLSPFIRSLPFELLVVDLCWCEDGACAGSNCMLPLVV